MDSGIQQWTDQKVRHEVARRRLLYLAVSIAVSTVTVVAIATLGRADIGVGGGLLMLLALLVNFAIVFWLFRWMSVPSKERARRRRLSVLKMLGVEDKEGSPVGVGAPSED